MVGVAAFTAAILLPSVSAFAADAPVDALINHGVELRRQGKQFEALETFQRAHAIAPSTRTYGQMGLAEASLQRWLEAEEHLSAALAAASDPWAKKNRTALEHGAALARSHISSVGIDGPAGAEISIGGTRAGALPMGHPVKVLAGEVVVSARSPGFRPFDTKVMVQGGQDTTIVVRLEPLSVAAPSPPSQPALLTTTPAATASASGTTDHRRTWRTWTAAVLGAAGVGAVVFGTTWAVVDGRSACSSPPGARCDDVYDTKTWGTTVLGAGVVAAGVAAYLVLTDWR